MDFPIGISATPFAVSVGANRLGSFSPGQSVDFVSLLGAGVSSFVVSGITPLTDPDNPMAFPIQLDFDTATADFTMTPLKKPDCAIAPATGGNLQFSWPTEPEVRYQLQTSTDLNTWTNDGALLQGSGQVLQALRAISPEAMRFWRVEAK